MNQILNAAVKNSNEITLGQVMESLNKIISNYEISVILKNENDPKAGYDVYTKTGVIHGKYEDYKDTNHRK